MKPATAPKPILRTCYFCGDKFLTATGRNVCDDCGMNRKGTRA